MSTGRGSGEGARRDRVQAVRFARILAADIASSSVLGRFCLAGKQLLNADGAAITVFYDTPQRHTMNTTSTLAMLIEEAQELAGEGPGFDAARTNKTVRADFSTPGGTRWTVLDGCVAQFGFTGAVLALPIKAPHRQLGVLVAHTLSARNAFDGSAADYLASGLGPVLLDHLGPDALEAELTEDWSSRAAVHQATGMVIVDLRLSAEDALTLLRAHAYATDSTLLEVAIQVVDGDLTFDHRDTEGG